MKRAHQIEVSRPLAFWLISLALVAVAVVLLHQVLTPFVVGLALAYLLDPPVNCLKARMNRLPQRCSSSACSSSSSLRCCCMGSQSLAQRSRLIEKLPVYIKRVRTLVADPPSVGR